MRSTTNARLAKCRRGHAVPPPAPAMKDESFGMAVGGAPMRPGRVALLLLLAVAVQHGVFQNPVMTLVLLGGVVPFLMAACLGRRLEDSKPNQPPAPDHQARVAINSETEQGAAHA